MILITTSILKIYHISSSLCWRFDCRLAPNKPKSLCSMIYHFSKSGWAPGARHVFSQLLMVSRHFSPSPPRRWSTSRASRAPMMSRRLFWPPRLRWRRPSSRSCRGLAPGSHRSRSRWPRSGAAHCRSSLEPGAISDFRSRSEVQRYGSKSG